MSLSIKQIAVFYLEHGVRHCGNSTWKNPDRKSKMSMISTRKSFVNYRCLHSFHTLSLFLISTKLTKHFLVVYTFRYTKDWVNFGVQRRKNSLSLSAQVRHVEANPHSTHGHGKGKKSCKGGHVLVQHEQSDRRCCLKLLSLHGTPEFQFQGTNDRTQVTWSSMAKCHNWFVWTWQWTLSDCSRLLQ